MIHARSIQIIFHPQIKIKKLYHYYNAKKREGNESYYCNARIKQ